MSFQPAAILFYGFSVEDGSELHRQILAGRDDGEPTHPAGRLAYTGKLEEEIAVGVGTWGFTDYPRFFVYAGESLLKADDYTELKIDDEILVPLEQWKGRIADFCMKYEMEFPDRFGWVLVPYYG